jgi:hypothetical protein
VGVTPPSGAGCTIPGPANINYDPASLASLFAYLSSNPQMQAGVIWIEASYSNSTGAAIDGTVVGAMSNFALTLKGGWTGVGTNINTSTPSVLGHYLWIFDWNANVTLSDITITGANSTQALSINTSKNIVLTRVKVDNNTTSSQTAYLYNAGAGTGNITITSSSFSQNTNTVGGLIVVSNGMITLSSVVASENDGYGAWLDNSSVLLAKNVTLSGTNDFNDNDNWGLQIDSRGLVTLNNAMASGNGIVDTSGNGLDINNTDGNPATAYGITFTGTNLFNGNYDYGLFILSEGPVKFSTLIANSNKNLTGAPQAGAYIDNSGAATAQPITGSGQFTYNGDRGLQILSIGTVTLNNITASNNGNHGAVITNSYGILAMPVTLTGTNSFNFNYLDGLGIFSLGAISVSNVTAIGNGQSGTSGDGAELDNDNAPSAQKITLTGVNKFTDNSFGAGLLILSRGIVTLNSVTSKDNGAVGINIDNATTATSPQSMALTGVNTSSGNGSTGLYIISKGLIKINSLTANENGEQGAWLDNNQTGAVGGVTLTGTNQFNDNFFDGLQIDTKGAVTLNSVTASNNGDPSAGNGVAVKNTYDNCIDLGSGCTVLSPKGVTLTGTNVFNGNYNTGLSVITYGTVSLSNVTANNNGILSPGGGYGLYVYNAGGLVKGVTLSGTNSLDNNHFTSVYIESYGPIKLNSTSATNTVAGHGAYLTNNGAPSAQSVTLAGTNVFSSNYGHGLSITSVGAVSLNNATASSNGSGGSGYDGVNIDNSGNTPQKVTLTGISFFAGNRDNGLEIYSKGAVSLQNISATGSLLNNGVKVDNTSGLDTLAQAVTISGTNTFSDNAAQGLHVESYGVITLNNVTATGNTGYGAEIINNLSNAATAPKVALTGTNTFSNNDNYGLSVVSKGAITSAFKLTASGNTPNSALGAILDNTYSTTMQGITLLGSNTFNDNHADGLSAKSYGSILINNLTASGNGTSGAGYGAALDNYVSGLAPAPKNVTLTGKNVFNSNQYTGLNITSFGIISVSNITETDSDQALNAGVSLINYTEGKGIIVSGTNTFSDNNYIGLWIESLGSITMNNITANTNASTGVYATNYAVAGAWAIKLTGTNRFEENMGAALEVYSKGAISVNSITAINNIGGSVLLDNDVLGATAGITMTGTNYFYGTTGGAAGLRIRSLGAVSLSNITADGNTASGLVIESASNVTISCGSFTNNTGRGLDITYSGLLTLKGVTASGNTSTDLSYVDSSPTIPPADLVIVRSC